MSKSRTKNFCRTRYGLLLPSLFLIPPFTLPFFVSLFLPGGGEGFVPVCVADEVGMLYQWSVDWYRHRIMLLRLHVLKVEDTQTVAVLFSLAEGQRGKNTAF